MYKFIIVCFLIWRIGLLAASKTGGLLIPQRDGFLGPSVWANFDGVHYLSIAQNGYGQFQDAFFPLYPLLIKIMTKSVFFGNYLLAGLFISYFAILIALITLYQLVKDDFSEKVSRLAVVGFLVFPTSFFFGTVYTESLFLMLILVSFYAARKNKWFLAGVFGGLATATKLVGIFLLPALFWQYFSVNKKQFNNEAMKQLPRLWWLLLIPAGLASYMWYLSNSVGDYLAFIHAQPAFGAQRTGGEIVLLPQVYWRYLKIFAIVPFDNYDFWIAIFEFFIFNLALVSLCWAWKKKINTTWIIFSLAALLGPTLTGTFSSIPRYTLVLFPIFILYGLIKNRHFLIAIFITDFLLLFILTILFTRGYFVA